MTYTTISVTSKVRDDLKRLCIELELKEDKKVSINSLLERVANNEFNVSGAFIRLSNQLDESIEKIETACNDLKTTTDNISADEFEG